jgi:ubiquinone/menaquinone biosynthesis C-methylase UbiE
MALKKSYIHGADSSEQDRLFRLNKLTNQAFLEFINPQKNSVILEIGSGLGILASEVAKNNPASKVIGIELLKPQLQKSPPNIPNLFFINGDVHTLPFPENTFDIVYGRYILEHVSQPEIVLKEIYKSLKSGGKLYLQENAILTIQFYPNCPKFDYAWKKFAELQTILGGDAMIGIKLYQLLKHTSFTEIEPSFTPEIHFYEKDTFIPWIDNLIGNLSGAKINLLKHNLLSETQFEDAIQELKKFKINQKASTYFYWNRIVGKKPETANK